MGIGLRHKERMAGNDRKGKKLVIYFCGVKDGFLCIFGKGNKEFWRVLGWSEAFQDRYGL